MHGIAVVSNAVAPAAGAGYAKADGGAKLSRGASASGTPRNVSSACTARKDSVALGDRRFFGKARALRTVSVGPTNSGRASRNLTTRAMGGRVDTTSDPWWTKNNASNMTEVHSMDELLQVLKANADKLVVVDYYARWCAACRALHPKLCKIAEENAHDVVVVKIEFDDNKDLCRGMGVRVLPYFQLYRGARGKVAAFSASISKVARIREGIAEHRPGGAYDTDPEAGVGWPGERDDAEKSGSEDEEPAGEREPAPAR